MVHAEGSARKVDQRGRVTAQLIDSVRNTNWDASLPSKKSGIGTERFDHLLKLRLLARSGISPH